MLEFKNLKNGKVKIAKNGKSISVTKEEYDEIVQFCQSKFYYKKSIISCLENNGEKQAAENDAYVSHIGELYHTNSFWCDIEELIKRNPFSKFKKERREQNVKTN